MKKSLFYLFLISSFLFSPIQAKPEFIFYPLEKSETSESKAREIKGIYDGLERKIINYADTLKNPVGEIKYARMQEHSVLVSSTEITEENTAQEKEGTFRVMVIEPKKYSGINIRYHPSDNESATVVIKLEAKTNSLESVTFLSKENGEKKEQRVITNEGKGIYKIVDFVFENNKEKEVLGRIVTEFDDFNPEIYTGLCRQYLLNYNKRVMDAGQAGKYSK